jgi:hypothetical protein
MLEGVVIDDTGLFNTRLKRVGGLLQLPQTAWSPRRPDPI